jgi:hypothetical protein
MPKTGCPVGAVIDWETGMFMSILSEYLDQIFSGCYLIVQVCSVTKDLKRKGAN